MLVSNVAGNAVSKRDALQSEKAKLESTIQTAEKYGLDVSAPRKRLAEIYGALDPGYQARANREGPLSSTQPVTTIADAMRLIDRSMKKNSTYGTVREQVKSQVADQLRRSQTLDPLQAIRTGMEATASIQGAPVPTKLPTNQSNQMAVDESNAESWNNWGPAKALIDGGGLLNILGNSAMAIGTNVASKFQPSLDELIQKQDPAMAKKMKSERLTREAGYNAGLNSLTGALDAFGQEIPKVPDPSKLIETLNPGMAGVAGGAFASGVVDILNPGSYLSAPKMVTDVGTMIESIGNAKPKDRPALVKQYADGMTGVSLEDKTRFWGKLLGNIGGGAAAGKLLKVALGDKVVAPKQLRQAGLGNVPEPPTDPPISGAISTDPGGPTAPARPSKLGTPKDDGFASEPVKVSKRVAEQSTDPLKPTVPLEAKPPKMGAPKNAVFKTEPELVSKTKPVEVATEPATANLFKSVPEAKPEPNKPMKGSVTKTPEYPVVPESERLSPPHDDYVDPETIAVHPDFQYRGKADKGAGADLITDTKANVTLALKGVSTYDVDRGGVLTVWEAKDGKRFVINGHHRLELAKRADVFGRIGPDGAMVETPKKVRISVYKEADGYSSTQARALGAIQNLGDGNGSSLDVAAVLRDLNIGKGDFTRLGISTRGMGKQVGNILSLHPETLNAVTSGSVKVNAAPLAGMGEAGLDLPRQKVMLDMMDGNPKYTTFEQGKNVADELKHSALSKAGGGANKQGSMFELDDISAKEISNIENRGLILAEVKRLLNGQRRALTKALGLDTLEGEVINKQARTEAADAIGSKDAVDEKLKFLLRNNPELNGRLNELANSVGESGSVSDAAAKFIPEIEQHVKSKTPEELFQSTLDSGGKGANVPGPDKPANQPPKGTRGKGKQPRSRESGKTDLKTIAAIGAVSALGVGAIAVNKWAEEQGFGDEFRTVAGAAGLVTLATILAKKGPKISPKAWWEVAAHTLAPTEVATRLKGTAMGAAMQRVLNANSTRIVMTGQYLKTIAESAKAEFGKDFLKHPEFAEWNNKIRDLMEENVANGRQWFDGMPAKTRAMVEKIRPVLDDVVERWEGIGGRVQVSNDARQAKLLQPGMVIKFADGTYGVFKEVLPTGEIVATKMVANPGAKFLSQQHPNFAHVKQIERIIDVGEAFGRPINRLGESFVPRVFTGNFIKRLESADPAFLAAFKQMLLNNNKHLGLTADELLSDVQVVVEGLSGTHSSMATWLANLEKPRLHKMSKFTLPDGTVVDPFETSYMDAVATYVHRASMRVSIAEQLGVDPKAMGEMIDGLRGMGKDGMRHARYIESMFNQIMGLGPETARETLGHKVALGESLYQTLLKLTGGTSVISQLNDVMFPLTEFGGGKVVKAAVKLAQDPDFRGDMDVLGAIHENWLRDLKVTNANPSIKPEGIGAKFIRGANEFLTKRGERMDGLGTMTDSVMTAIGFRAMDRFAKRLGMASSVVTAQDLLLKGATKGLSASEARTLDRLGLTGTLTEVNNKVSGGADPNVVIGKLMADQKVQSMMSAKVRGRLVYTGAPEDLPLSASSPVGSVLWRFKKPIYIGTRFMVDSVLSEASKGNFRPMARFVGYGLGVGGGLEYIKNVLRGEGIDDETREMLGKGQVLEALQRFFVKPGEDTLGGKTARYFIDQNNGKGLMSVLSAAGHAIYESGAMGAYGDFNPALNRNAKSPIPGKDSLNVTGPLVPIAAQSIGRLYDVASNTIQLGDWVHEGKPWYQAEADQRAAMANIYEAIRSEAIPVRRFLDMIGVKPNLVKLRELQRKEKGELNEYPERMKGRMTGNVLSPQEYVDMKILDKSENGVKDRIESRQRKGKRPSLKSRINN